VEAPQYPTRDKIDIDGPHGNAFHLLGKARVYAKNYNLDPTPIIDEMMAGNYTNLLAVFEYHFDEHATLVTTNGKLRTDVRKRLDEIRTNERLDRISEI